MYHTALLNSPTVLRNYFRIYPFKISQLFKRHFKENCIRYQLYSERLVSYLLWIGIQIVMNLLLWIVHYIYVFLRYTIFLFTVAKITVFYCTYDCANWLRFVHLVWCISFHLSIYLPRRLKHVTGGWPFSVGLPHTIAPHNTQYHVLYIQGIVVPSTGYCGGSIYLYSAV